MRKSNNHKPRVILFNGPPRSGKDTASKIMCEYIDECVVLRFSEPLKNSVHAMFGLRVPHDHFEDVKDEPQLVLGNRTPRECYIDLSESYVKLSLGKSFWGKSLVTNMRSYPWCSVFIIPDLGFIEELEPIVEYLGIENISIIQVYREGKSFYGDSRNYVDLKGIRTFILNNSGTLTNLRDTCETIVKSLYIPNN